MKQFNLPYHGYVVLESQGKDDSRRSTNEGKVSRKPLKGRKIIGPKDARTIPLMDREAWNILARRFKIEKAKWDQRKHGEDKLDYLLFDDLEWNKANVAIKNAYTLLNLEPKSFHSCRHSYVTFLVGKTRSFFLVRAITGHKSKAFERYLHVYEQIALQAKQASQEIEEI